MRINKNCLPCVLVGLLLSGLTMPASAMRYIGISSVNNVPLFNIRSIEDFKMLISENHLSMLYRSPTQIIAIADGTYFSFATGEYNTLEDFEAGEARKFKKGSDFYAAQKLGIETGDFYYWYTNNTFRSVEDANDAYQNGFFFTSGAKNQNSSQCYYTAKELGYSSYKDYQDYITYTDLGYETKDEWKKAKDAGFQRASEFKSATDAGYTTFEEYDEAKKLGFEKSKSSYDSYKAMTASIDKVVEKDKLTRTEALVLILLQDFPKGEMSTSVLSNRLHDMLYKNSDISKALSSFVFGTSGNDYYNRNRNQNKSLDSLVSISGLQNFFTTVDIGKYGSYDKASDVFKKR